VERLWKISTNTKKFSLANDRRTFNFTIVVLNLRLQNMKIIKILGVKIFSGSESQALDLLKTWLKSDQKRLIFTPNPEQLVQAGKDKAFKKILNQSDLNLPDGIGLVWFSSLKHKISGTDFMLKLIGLAGQYNLKVGFLGSKRGVAPKAGRIIKKNYSAKLVFAHHGVDNINSIDKSENKKLIQKINQAGVDILFVAFGAPKQEKWLYHNLSKLNIKLGMVVGGALDQLVDPSLCPPKFIEEIGLGWLYRLLRQPWRIKRQLKLIKFISLVNSN